VVATFADLLLVTVTDVASVHGTGELFGDAVLASLSVIHVSLLFVVTAIRAKSERPRFLVYKLPVVRHLVTTFAHYLVGFFVSERVSHIDLLKLSDQMSAHRT
jgi:hypothetical protein